MDSLRSTIHIKYDIYNPPEKVFPNDILSGKFILENVGNKDKKLKKVFIRVVEYYEKYEKYADQEGSGPSRHWVGHGRTLGKNRLNHPNTINAGEVIELEFEIQLPSKWRPRLGKRLRDWHIYLAFKHKSGLMVSSGSVKSDAYCTLPVEGSQRTPSSIFLKKSEIKNICSNCGKKVSEGAAFCQYCGSELPKIIYCPSCGKQILKRGNFCENCGEKISDHLLTT